MRIHMTSDHGTLPDHIRQRRAVVAELSQTQGGVMSRSQLYRLGISRGEVRANVYAQRWRRIGVHVLVVDPLGLGKDGRLWAAVLEAGPRAALDADAALLVCGLENYVEPRIRVSVPRGARIRHRATLVNIRQTRRWRAEDIVYSGKPPHIRAPVAAIHAALWAATARQAELLLTMVVQQGICRLDELAAAFLAVRRDRRRAMIHSLLIDLAGGVRSLNELDVLRGLRDRGLPLPDMQALRRTSRGTYFLDFRWSRWGLVVEVDGIQHNWAQAVVGDALRHNAIAIEGDVVLRLPVLGLRLCPDDFYTQISTALRRAGCVLPEVA